MKTAAVSEIAMNVANETTPTRVETARITNAMSVDVEEYFQVSALESHFDRASWDTIPSRVETSIQRILELFDRFDARATFFTLGWIAERHPRMLRRIADAGHEIASHGMHHVQVFRQDRATFHADASRARSLLEDISGQRVRGYRAASFSIGRNTPWAHDALAEAGYTYSSSIYPGHHDAYGMPGAPRFVFRDSGSGILEVPITTATLGRQRFPCAGGGFFRLYPYAVTRAALRRINRKETQAAVFYFHPWELDPAQPRVSPLPWKTRFRHYLNLERVEPRLCRLLADFSWDRLDRVFPVTPSPG